MSREAPSKLAEVADGVYRAGGIMVLLAMVIASAGLTCLLSALSNGAVLGLVASVVYVSFSICMLALYFVGKKRMK